MEMACGELICKMSRTMMASPKSFPFIVIAYRLPFRNLQRYYATWRLVGVHHEHHCPSSALGRCVRGVRPGIHLLFMAETCLQAIVHQPGTDLLESAKRRSFLSRALRHVQLAVRVVQCLHDLSRGFARYTLILRLAFTRSASFCVEVCHRITRA